MAKKLKEGDLPFDVPKFDEDEFVRKELISFKTTTFLFGFTLVVALATLFLWRATNLDFFPLLLVAILPAVLIRPIYKAIRIPIDHWGRKEWIGTYVLYFFFWLGFTLLAVNPPFSDSAGPAIDVAATPHVQGEGYPITFEALIRDNRDLDEASVVFCLHKVDGDPPASYAALSASQQDACRVAWQDAGQGRYSHVFSPAAPSAGTYAWFVLADDNAGHSAEASGTIRVADPFNVFTPAPADDPTFDEITDRLVVEPASGFGQDLRVAQYTMDDPESEAATWHNMVRDEDEGHWYTNPRFPGWAHGPNVVGLRLVEHPYYLDQEKVAGGFAWRSDATFNITVEASLPVASENEPSIEERQNAARVVTPGPEAPLMLLVLAVAGLVAGRRGT